MDLSCTGVVAGVMTGVKVHFLEARDAGASQSFLARAGRRDGQTQHTHHRSCLHAAELRRAPSDRLGGNSSLPIGRSRER